MAADLANTTMNVHGSREPIDQAGELVSAESPSALDVLILRDPRESTKKCSLTPLRGFPGVRFLTWKVDRRFEVGSRVLLHADGEEISAADAGRPLLLIDCAWRRVPQLLASCEGELTPRRLPKLTTAYPRRSMTFVDPEQGLASIEALYAALALLGDCRPELLAHYLWGTEFLTANPGIEPRDRLARTEAKAGLKSAEPEGTPQNAARPGLIHAHGKSQVDLTNNAAKQHSFCKLLQVVRLFDPPSG